MIKFTLLCDNGHDFEGWFSSNDDYDGQKQRGLVACPMCDSPNVDKALMAPAVKVRRNHETPQMPQSAQSQMPVPSMPAPMPTPMPTPMPVPMPTPGSASAKAPETLPASVPVPTPEQVMQVAAQIEVMREFRKRVLKSSEDVGEKFTEEARKIHYGEAEKRGIHGAAKLEDIKELVEEGVEVLPLPTLPEDQN